MGVKLQYRVEINLNGPDGNAFALIRKAKYLGVKLDLSKDEIDSIVKEMMSGDYDNLVEVFKTNFGQLVRLVKIQNGNLVETLN
jgi:hypothetical protein